MFSLTHQERQVILFLLSVAFIGIAINILIKRYSRLEVVAYIQQDTGKININLASAEEFESLPGIGEKLAKAIVEYRHTHGDFRDIGELKNIRGIYQYRFEKIKDYIKVK